MSTMDISTAIVLFQDTGVYVKRTLNECESLVSFADTLFICAAVWVTKGFVSGEGHKHTNMKCFPLQKAKVNCYLSAL